MNIKLRRILIFTCLVLVSLGCNFVTVIEPTATPEPPTPTFTPTLEPKPTATNTTQPGPAGIPDDWQLFTAEGMEIWLPASYVGGNLEEDLPVVIENLQALGSEYAAIAETIEQNPDMYVMMAVDTNLTSSGYLTNLTIASETTLSSIPMDTYMDVLEQQLPAGYQVIERGIVSVGEYQAGRMILETRIYDIGVNVITFMILNDTEMWVVTFTTEAADFEGLLPVFEQSIQSFRIIQ